MEEREKANDPYLKMRTATRRGANDICRQADRETDDGKKVPRRIAAFAVTSGVVLIVVDDEAEFVKDESCDDNGR